MIIKEDPTKIERHCRQERGCETIQIKNALKKLRYFREKSKNAGDFLKKIVIGIARFLYRSRKIVVLVIAVVLVTLVFSYLIAPWSSNSFAPNDEYNRTISTTGKLEVKGLEIYGGDVTSDSGKVYIDWGELTLGASKNASFYVLSNSNVNVTLGLNVTNWMPAGIEDYITIPWNYNGTVLTPQHEPLLVTVTLEVPASREFIEFLVENSVTTFGFDMTIYASGV
jgi:hypothetical protein